jgi:hypothetical protein
VTKRGTLLRGDPWRNLEELIGAMLLTSPDVWPHAPWFGLNHIVSDPNKDGRHLRPALEEALRELGVTWAEVDPDSVRLESNDRRCERTIEFRLVAVDGSGASRTFSVTDDYR